MYDTIIIGAGMSGLAAGIRLAYYEQRVCILERHTTIGGLNSFYRLRGRDYDVGLHALTNITPKGTKTGPLARLLRQLRLKWEDFAISPQVGSEIAFPNARLRFDNDIATLRDEVARAFPRQADNFDRLTREIVEYDDLSDAHANMSAREVVSSIITEPLLVEMLFCPLMFYGSAREDDMDWGQFSIMFRSIFLEGLGRPQAGVRLILKHLVKKFRALGGELKLRAGVKRLAVDDGRVVQVELENDEVLEGRNVLSSAGWCETMRLCDDGHPVVNSRAPGQLTFCETIATLANSLGARSLATGEIREKDGRGRHTTTSRSLHPLPSGGVLVDNPGIRELQLPACEEGLLEVFDDVMRIAEGCRFSDCSHDGDAGCAVVAALESGDLDPRRFANFQKLNAEQAHNSRSLAERHERDRKMGRMIKSILKDKRRVRDER